MQVDRGHGDILSRLLYVTQRSPNWPQAWSSSCLRLLSAGITGTWHCPDTVQEFSRLRRFLSACEETKKPTQESCGPGSSKLWNCSWIKLLCLPMGRASKWAYLRIFITTGYLIMGLYGKACVLPLTTCLPQLSLWQGLFTLWLLSLRVQTVWCSEKVGYCMRL